MDKKQHVEWERAVYSGLEDFKSPAMRTKKVASVYNKIKMFSIIGLFVGVFPVHNSCFGSSACELSFQRCSFHYIWSLMTFFTKTAGLIYIVVVMFVLSMVGKWKWNNVDLIAWVMVYLTSFSLGAILHIVHVKRTKEVIALLQLIDLYDEKYNRIRPTAVVSRKVMSCLVASFLVIIAPCWILFNLMEKFDYLMLEGVKFHVAEFFGDNKLIMVAGLIGVMSVVEYGVTLYYILLFYFGALMRDRLEDIGTTIHYKSVSKGNLFGKMKFGGMDCKGKSSLKAVAVSPRPGISTSNKWGNGAGSTNPVVKLAKDGNGPDDGVWAYQCSHTHKSWLAISQQYLDFHDVHDQYCDFIGSSFIVLFATLTISLVCMVFCYSGAENQFVANSGLTMLGMVVASFLRILFLADVGEAFLKKHAEMLKSLSKVQQSAHFMPGEKSQFKQLFVTATTLPVRLNAMGFFTVSRQNVTSILSVIITYVIVLMQFRSTGVEFVSSGNGTVGFNKTEEMY